MCCTGAGLGWERGRNQRHSDQFPLTLVLLFCLTSFTVVTTKTINLKPGSFPGCLETSPRDGYCLLNQTGIVSAAPTDTTLKNRSAYNVPSNTVCIWVSRIWVSRSVAWAGSCILMSNSHCSSLSQNLPGNLHRLLMPCGSEHLALK